MIRQITLILILLYLSGCSLIYSYDSNLVQHVDQWIKEENYILAVDTIDHIDANHKNYKQLQNKKREILLRLSKLERDAIKDSDRLAKQGEWLLALKRVDEAEKKLINKKSLTAHKIKLLQQRNDVIRSYEVTYLYSQARYLSSKMALYEKLRKTISDKEKSEFDIVEFNTLRNDTSTQLFEQAEQQYKNNNYYDALSTIKLALSLKPDKTISASLNKLRELIHKLNKTKQQAYIASVESLLISLQKGYSYALLKNAKNKISWLKQNEEYKAEHKILINKLERHIRIATKRYFNTAIKLYSVGEIQEALTIWLKLKEIVPHYPKLNAHIQRAKKILKKFNRLSDKARKKQSLSEEKGN